LGCRLLLRRADRPERRRKTEGADAKAFWRQKSLHPHERRRKDQKKKRGGERELRLPPPAARRPFRRARGLSRRERQGSLAARHGFSQETSEKVSCGRANRGFSADATPPPAGPDVLRPALTIASSLGRLRHPIGDADRTAHAGAAEAAIAHR